MRCRRRRNAGAQGCGGFYPPHPGTAFTQHSSGDPRGVWLQRGGRPTLAGGAGIQLPHPCRRSRGALVVYAEGSMTQPIARILIVTSGPLCRNPRVLKEATALGEAGYAVTVLAPVSLNRYEAFDREILRTAPF